MSTKAFTLNNDFVIPIGQTPYLEKNDNVSLKLLQLIGDLLDENCSGIGDWIDNDSGNAESTQETFDSLETFKFNSKDSPNYAQRTRTLGGGYPNQFTVEIKLYHDELGDGANNSFLIFCYQADEAFVVRFGRDGIFVYDTDESGWQEVGTDLVKQYTGAEWQIWRLLVTFTGTTGDGTCNVILKDSAHDWEEKVGSDVPCSFEDVNPNGLTELIQRGLDDPYIITHVDYLKIDSGLKNPYATTAVFRMVEFGQPYSIKANPGYYLTFSAFAASISGLGDAKFRYAKDDSGLSWPGTGWSAWKTAAEMDTACGAGDLDGKLYIYFEAQFSGNGIQKVVLYDATVTYDVSPTPPFVPPLSFPKIGYENLLDATTITASTTAGGYNVDNLKDWRVYTYWKGTGAAAQWIKVDTGSPHICDYLALVSHDLNTQGVTGLAFKYSSNDVDWFDCFTPFTPNDDKLIFKSFPAQNARYYRLEIPAGYTNPPFIGIMACGELLAFPTGLRIGFDPTPERVVARLTRSQRGHFLGSIVDYVERNFNVEFNYLDPTWMENYFNPFWDNHAILLKPFIWSWNPDYKPEETFLVSLPDGSEIRRPYAVPATRNLSFSMVGIKE